MEKRSQHGGVAGSHQLQSWQVKLHLPCFLSSSLLTGKVVEHVLDERLGTNSWLLASAGSSSGHCRYLGSELANIRSLYEDLGTWVNGAPGSVVVAGGY